MDSLLIIFAKEPAPGQVKTRLSPDLSPQAAAELYRGFIEDILEEMARLPHLRLALAYSPASARDFFAGLTPAGTLLFHQEGEDLGERMARALEWGFREAYSPPHFKCNELSDYPIDDSYAFNRKQKTENRKPSYRPVLLRGSDTPDLPGEMVQEAADALTAGNAELVLGPAMDGGYYLVGLNAPRPELFRDIAWSTPQVLTDTLKLARSLGLRVHLLPAWRDIDAYPDLLRFLSRPHPRPQPGWRTHRLARGFLEAPKIQK